MSQGHGVIGGFFRQHRARQQMRQAIEAHMTDNGIPIPPKPLSFATAFMWGFLSGLLTGLLVGFIFWELT